MMYAYLRFESPDLGVRHELADLQNIPKCGDTIIAQSGTTAVVTDIISTHSGQPVREPYQGAIEIHCTPVQCPVEVTRESIMSNLTMR